jgi:hypothetical protein
MDEMATVASGARGARRTGAPFTRKEHSRPQCSLHAIGALWPGAPFARERAPLRVGRDAHGRRLSPVRPRAYAWRDGGFSD